MSEPFEHPKITIDDIQALGAIEPVTDDADLEETMARGRERFKQSLLLISEKRPLTGPEIDQLRMLLGTKEPTPEFSQLVLAHGEEK